MTDEYSNLLDEINDQVHTPSSPGVFEYHTEEICLKCHSYSDDAKESKKGTNFLDSGGVLPKHLLLLYLLLIFLTFGLYFLFLQ